MTRDPLDDLGPRDAGLVDLFNHLTGQPSADELSGEYAALTMFRTAPGAPAAPSPVRHRRASRGRIGARLAAAATMVALGGGFAAAAYAEVLPAPLQRVAHQLLGFAGVPNSRGNPTPKKQTVPVTSRHTNPGGSNSPQPGSSGSPRSSSPSPHPSSSASPSPSGSVTITAAQRQVAAGSSVQVTASFTRRALTVAGVSLSLAELAAGQTTWHVVGQATTGPGGQAGFSVPNLTTNATFRVRGPGHAASGELSIVVVPAITVSEVSGSHGRSELLVVSVPLAQRHDVVRLEYLAGGQWHLARVHRLHRGGQTEFSVVARKISVTYRVVLPATVEHGQSVSDQVTVAARPRKGGQGGD